MGLRISPVGAMEWKEELGVIHDFTFSESGATVRQARKTREPKATLETENRSVNTDTDWLKVPESRLAGFMRENITRILG